MGDDVSAAEKQRRKILITFLIVIILP